MAQPSNPTHAASRPGLWDLTDAERRAYEHVLSEFRRLAMSAPGMIRNLRESLASGAAVVVVGPNPSLLAKFQALRGDIDAYLAAIESGEIPCAAGQSTAIPCHSEWSDESGSDDTDA